MHRLENLRQRFVHGKVERAEVDDLQLAGARQLLQTMVSEGCAGQVLFRIFLEDDNDDRLALSKPLGSELCREGGLSAACRAGDHHCIARRDTAAHDLVQPRHSRGQTLHRLRFARTLLFRNAWEYLDAGIRDAKGMQPGHWRCATGLDDLELPHHRVAIRDLRQPEHAVGHREDRAALFLFGVLAKEEGSYFPAGQVQRQALDEVVYGERSFGESPLHSSTDGAKRVDDDDPRLHALDLAHNPGKNLV